MRFECVRFGEIKEGLTVYALYGEPRGGAPQQRRRFTVLGFEANGLVRLRLEECVEFDGDDTVPAGTTVYLEAGDLRRPRA